MGLNPDEKKTVIEFAKGNMRINAAARALFLSNNAVDYRLKRIREKTGLDPKNFFDLVQLVRLIC